MKKTSTISFTDLPFELETRLEREIAADPAWKEGIAWGEPRSGHPEGQVIFHIRDVLRNVDRFYCNDSDRARLRLIGLVHDAFKYKRQCARGCALKKSHGYWARIFASHYINDIEILNVIELHDKAYKAFLRMTRDGDRDAAEADAIKLITRLGSHTDLFKCFYFCDNRTGDKSSTHFEWFNRLVGKS